MTSTDVMILEKMAKQKIFFLHIIAKKTGIYMKL